ncbi:uncharacterized protein TRAVEDRAFT_109911 [Trametes versicolor FP-101664 SS1]|uniref:uncharacterized protein n=1 Tax=Trametes versicolor (strain FP-101664) TaxID=717944 RepID=UPI0004624672|nr:uncharacterized protein TRAVEDRAFT_109911 [Trametes versicolor FP-101664 SS1]EIW64119.1 hypothetical protein TRAVEDRAFT_109911 [Trametes versicolor FP-101664 SS1]
MDGIDGLGGEGSGNGQGARIHATGGAIFSQKCVDWSSSPLINPSGSQERAADDDFFSAGTGADASVASGSSINAAGQPPLPINGSGFASAATLHGRTAPPRPFTGFSSAAKLPARPQSRPIHQPDERTTATPSAPSKFAGFGLASALPLQAADDQPPSPPPQQDYDSWFDSEASALPPDAVGFKTARAILDTSEDAVEPPASQISQFGGFTSGLAKWKPASQASENEDTEADLARANVSSGFTSAALVDPAAAPMVSFSTAAHILVGKTNWAAPSAEALARAAQKMKQWEAEIDLEEQPSGAANTENNAPPNSHPPASRPPSLETPLRPVLRPMENGFSVMQPPDTPSPAGAAPKNPPHFTVVAGMTIKNTPFKSPLMAKHQAQPRSVSAPSLYTGSPLNPERSTGFRAAPFVSPAKPGTMPFASPMKASTSSLASPVKALGMTPRRLGFSSTAGKGKFASPFKPGLAPGDPGRSQLDLKLKEEQARANSAAPVQIQVVGAPSSKGKERKDCQFFDLNPVPERQTLASSGLQPLSYTEDDLEDMGINVEELRQMRPSNAVFYRFNSAVATVGIEDPAESEQLGPKAAFVHLKERGCDLVTQEWVTTQYGLILWKLAGLVCLEPEREQNVKTKRWCWPEVIRQLLYRYERELVGGSRPALRLVSTEDAPAACPMILCVSNIVILGTSPRAKNGTAYEPHPELEVTDGWYRLRANVDLPLARAIRRGRICIGSKLAISGAKLSGGRKEPCEILDAYDNTMLELTGNCTNLAPWHAKLGFVKQPFIATLDKLTPDGGNVPAMDLIITKTYPIAFLEFIKHEDGSTSKIGPRDEKEEMKAHDQWLAKQEMESSKIRERLEADVQHLLKLAERLYSRAGPHFDLSFSRGDPMPDYIEGLYEKMMEQYLKPSQAWDRMDAFTAGWLHVYCKQQADLAMARLQDDLEKEMRDICPPRNVRDFRVVVAKDARWHKKEAMRSVQITVWDPLKVVFTENGSPGEIKEGQRFLVTNLMPNQGNAWMTPAPGAEVYLVAKRTSRWTNIKSAKC